MNQISFPFMKQREKLVLEPSPDLIVLCKRCGRQIITQRKLSDGKNKDSYVGFNGECWPCKNGLK